MDFSHITTYQQCQDQVAQGTLVKVLLMPKRFGGPDVQHNQLFVPPVHAQLIDQANEMVAKLLLEKQPGEEIDYNTAPEYKGDSYVPSKVTISAKLSISGGSIKQAISIW